MLELVAPWLLFALAALAITIAGRSLSADADRIAADFGLGRGFVGVILLGAVTSLPELVTTVSAASPLVRSGDIAVGNVFGSNLFNLVILALVDPFTVRKRLSTGNVVTGIVAIGLTAVAAIGLVLRSSLSLGPVSLVSLGILLGYVGGMWIIYLAERDQLAREQPSPPTGRPSLRPLLRFAVAALFVVGAGVAASWSVDAIADQTGLARSFAGALLLAFATSLPELVVSIAALRLGSAEMAVGNLFGSNSFNVVILVAADLAAGGGSIYAGISPGHAVVALLSVGTLCLALLGGLVGVRRRLPLLRLGWDTAGIAALYTVGMAYLFFS